MSRSIRFTPAAWADYTWWQGQDKKTLRRINTLIEAAHGDYLWFLDSDDKLLPGAIPALQRIGVLAGDGVDADVGERNCAGVNLEADEAGIRILALFPAPEFLNGISLIGGELRGGHVERIRAHLAGVKNYKHDIFVMYQTTDTAASGFTGMARQPGRFASSHASSAARCAALSAADGSQLATSHRPNSDSNSRAELEPSPKE